MSFALYIIGVTLIGIWAFTRLIQSILDGDCFLLDL